MLRVSGLGRLGLRQGSHFRTFQRTFDGRSLSSWSIEVSFDGCFFFIFLLRGVFVVVYFF